jgi:hypothetical protein
MSRVANTTNTTLGCNVTIHGFIPISSDSVSVCVYLYGHLLLTYVWGAMAGRYLLTALAFAVCHYRDPSDHNARCMRKHARRFGMFLTLAIGIELAVALVVLYCIFLLGGWLARLICCCRRSDRVLDDFKGGSLEEEAQCAGDETAAENGMDEIVIEVSDGDCSCVEEVGNPALESDSEASDGAFKCPICLQPGVRFYTTPCGHKFHHQCILEWFAIRSTCPMCNHVCCGDGAAPA